MDYLKEIEKLSITDSFCYEQDKKIQSLARLVKGLFEEYTGKDFPFLCGEYNFFSSTKDKFSDLSKMEKELNIPAYDWNQSQIEVILRHIKYTHDMEYYCVALKDYISFNNPNNNVLDNIAVEKLVPDIVNVVPISINNMLNTIENNSRKNNYNEQMIAQIKLGAILLYYGEKINCIGKFNLEEYMSKDSLILNAGTKYEIIVPVSQISKRALDTINTSRKINGIYFKYTTTSAKTVFRRINLSYQRIVEFGIYDRLFNSNIFLDYYGKLGKSLPELSKIVHKQSGYGKRFDTQWYFDRFLLRYFQWRYLAHGVEYDIPQSLLMI